jgi:hypothetical protein
MMALLTHTNASLIGIKYPGSANELGPNAFPVLKRNKDVSMWAVEKTQEIINPTSLHPSTLRVPWY